MSSSQTLSKEKLDAELKKRGLPESESFQEWKLQAANLAPPPNSLICWLLCFVFYFLHFSCQPLLLVSHFLCVDAVALSNIQFLAHANLIQLVCSYRGSLLQVVDRFQTTPLSNNVMIGAIVGGIGGFVCLSGLFGLWRWRHVSSFKSSRVDIDRVEHGENNHTATERVGVRVGMMAATRANEKELAKDGTAMLIDIEKQKEAVHGVSGRPENGTVSYEEGERTAGTRKRHSDIEKEREKGWISTTNSSMQGLFASSMTGNDMTTGSLHPPVAVAISQVPRIPTADLSPSFNATSSPFVDSPTTCPLDVRFCVRTRVRLCTRTCTYTCNAGKR